MPSSINNAQKLKNMSSSRSLVSRIIHRVINFISGLQLIPIISRRTIANHYLTGNGIEVGALHVPLPLPFGAKVQYVDTVSPEELNANYPDLGGQKITLPDIISDLETLNGIDNESQDFVIANHVLEHVEDPIKAVKSISRVLKSNGIAYLAIPEKTQTFDHAREVTSLAHLIKDHQEGPDGSLEAHYYDWCRHMSGLEGNELDTRVKLLMETRGNIHFHVWEYRDMMEFFHYMSHPDQSELDVQMSLFQGNEVIWILQKR